MPLEDLLKSFLPTANGAKPVRTAPADAIPAVREPEPGTDFLPPDPTLPAVSRRQVDINDLLSEIAENTRHLRDPAPGVVWETLPTPPLPAAAGEQSLQGTEYVRHIYIPNVPRPVIIFAGSSQGLFLGSLTTGQSLQVELPYAVSGIYILYQAGTAGQVILAYLSSRKIDISVMPAGAVWG